MKNEAMQKPVGTTPKYSGGKDYSIGRPNGTGRVNNNYDNSFTQKDKRETGLTLREPL